MTQDGETGWSIADATVCTGTPDLAGQEPNRTNANPGDGQRGRRRAVSVQRRHAERAEPANAADDAAIALTPTFVSGTESYTADVLYSVVSTTVTATPTHASATEVIKLGGTEDADGTVSLTLGDNVITVEVTAQDSATKTYTVTVTRAQSVLSGTALVSNIGQDTSSAGLLGSFEWVQSFITGNPMQTVTT